MQGPWNLPASMPMYVLGLRCAQMPTTPSVHTPELTRRCASWLALASTWPYDSHDAKPEPASDPDSEPIESPMSLRHGASG